METILQLWQGTVTEVSDKEFTAIISDITNSNNPDEQVVIDRKEVSTDDYDLIFPGAMFYWFIGYIHDSGKTRRRVSTIRFFHGLPALSKCEFDRVQSDANELLAIFDD